MEKTDRYHRYHVLWLWIIFNSQKGYYLTEAQRSRPESGAALWVDMKVGQDFEVDRKVWGISYRRRSERGKLSQKNVIWHLMVPLWPYIS